MGNYLTNTELKAWKINGAVIDLSGYTDPELDAFIVEAEALTELITQDRFYSFTATYYFNGNGKTALHFCRTPQQSLEGEMVAWRNISITTLKFVDVDQTVLEEIDEDDDFVRYPFYLEVARDYNPSFRNTSGFRYDNGNWPRGQRNIEIVGTWGWATTPHAIKKATALLSLEYAVAGSTQMIPGDIKQQAWPDLTVTFGGPRNAGQDSGFRGVDRLLSYHINHLPNFTNIVPEGKDEDYIW